MESKEFTSVKEMDDFFESNKVEVKEEPKADEAQAEVVEEIPTLDEEGEEEEAVEEEEVESESEEEVEEIETPKHKPSKEEKREYAFSKMRKEAAEAKRAYEERDVLVQRLMKEAGYDDYGKFKEALDKQFADKEMKDKGYTKEQFNEVEALKQRTKQLEAQLEMTSKRELATKAQTFDTMVKTYASQFKVSPDDIYASLDSSGYTADLLLNLPNPEVLIRGVLADKVKPVEKPLKKAVDTEKLPSSNAQKSNISVDELVKADMDEYLSRKGRA